MGKEKENTEVPTKNLETRKPKRILHFSDGTIEEYSSEEEEEASPQVEKSEKRDLIDPRDLSWLGWMSHGVWFAGSGFVGACDAAGEKLAWWFGITSPKYYYEMQEAIRMKEEEEKRKSRQDAEMSGWTNSVKENNVNTQDLASSQVSE